MALTNAYATATEFREFCRIDALSDAGMHDTILAAASRQVDKYTGRRFWQDGTVVAREYFADNAYVVQTDDISTTTGLVVKVDVNGDGTFARTLTISTDFLCFPLNAADDVPAKPFTELRIADPSVSDTFAVPSMRPGVQVTAKFGWAAVPDEVKVATILQAQMLWSAKDARGGILSASVDGFATRMSRFLHPQAELLLVDFVRAPR